MFKLFPIQAALENKGVDLTECRFTFKNWKCPTNEEEFLNNIEWIDYVPNLKWAEVVAYDNLKASEEPLRLLRIERNRILQQSDWRDLPSYPGTDQEAWRTYRQALRDITETQTPQLDEFGNLTNITWPEEPA